MVNRNDPAEKWSEAITESRSIDWNAEASDELPEGDARLLERFKAIARVAEGNRQANATQTQKIELPFHSWGHLRLLERIGEGSYGEVFRAWDDTLRREVALKLFKVAENGQDNAALSNDLLSEARHLALVKHENVVRVFGAEVHRGRVGFWMEYVVGVPLSVSLEDRGALDAAEASTIGIKICRALSAVHGAGLLHRDIKPENVVREAGGRYYLMDFGAGAARNVGIPTSPQLAGTPLYMAPEVFRSGETSVQSDIYSLGVLLFYMVTLRHPVEAQSYAELRKNSLDGERVSLSELRPDLPQEFRRVVDRCLSHDPAARYPTAAELETALVDVIAPERVTVVPSSSRWLNVTLAAALAAVLLMQVPWRAWFSPSLSDQIDAIAVMPLENVAAVDADTYLLDGLSQSLATRLSKLDDIRIAAWKQSRELARSGLPTGEIAAELGVDAVLEGGAVVEGERILGHVELIRASDETQLWSTDFDESVDDIFTLQRDLSRAIAARLKGALTGEERLALARPAARSVDAYELYLKGSNALDSNARERADEAEMLFDRALEIDPDFVDALIGKGVVAMNRWFFAWEGGREVLEVGKRSYERALQLDPTSAEAANGVLTLAYEDEQLTGVPELGMRLARGLRHWQERNVVIAQACIFGGVPEIGVELLDRVLADDPTNVQAHWFHVSGAVWEKNYDKALKSGEEYFLKFGEDPEVHLWMGVAYLRQHHPQDALIHFERARQLYAANPVSYYYEFLAQAQVEAGRPDEARATLEEGLRWVERVLARYPTQSRVRQDAILMYSELGDRLAVAHHIDQLRAKDSEYLGVVVDVSRLLLGEPQDIDEFLRTSSSPGLRWMDYSLHLDIDEMVEVYPELGPVVEEAHRKHLAKVAALREELDL